MASYLPGSVPSKTCFECRQNDCLQSNTTDILSLQEPNTTVYTIRPKTQVIPVVNVASLESKATIITSRTVAYGCDRCKKYAVSVSSTSTTVTTLNRQNIHKFMSNQIPGLGLYLFWAWHPIIILCEVGLLFTFATTSDFWEMTHLVYRCSPVSASVCTGEHTTTDSVKALPRSELPSTRRQTLILELLRQLALGWLMEKF